VVAALASLLLPGRPVPAQETTTPTAGQPSAAKAQA
jgi:hypothetical protein